MQRVMCIFALGGAALTVLLAVSHLSANPADPLNGTWELNLAKSKFDPGPGPKSQTRTYEVTGHTEKLSSKGVDSEGKPTAVEFTASYDGKDYPVTGLPNVETISVKRIDDHTFESTQKKAGKVVATGTRVISKDGKTLTSTTKGTNAKGEAFNNTMVFDKKK